VEAAEEYPWSSARAHLGWNEDLFLDAAGWRAHVSIT
jgi:hypothetical protein